jgi:hypothetical protein
MSSTCFESNGSSSVSRLYTQVWYSVFYIAHSSAYKTAYIDACETYHTITAYTTVLLKMNPTLSVPNNPSGGPTVTWQTHGQICEIWQRSPPHKNSSGLAPAGMQWGWSQNSNSGCVPTLTSWSSACLEQGTQIPWGSHLRSSASN